MKNKPVWQIAIEIMLRDGDTYLSRNNFDQLDSIGIAATHTKMPRMHPLDRHVAVLNALEKSGRFNKRLVRLDRVSRMFEPKTEALAEVELKSSAKAEGFSPTPRTGQ